MAESEESVRALANIVKLKALNIQLLKILISTCKGTILT